MSKLIEDYALIGDCETGALRAIAGPHMVLLHAETELEGQQNATISKFSLAEGESRSFVLTCCPLCLKSCSASKMMWPSV